MPVFRLSAGRRGGFIPASRRVVRVHSPRLRVPIGTGNVWQRSGPGIPPDPLFHLFSMPEAGGRTGEDQPANMRRARGTRPGRTAWKAGIEARSALQERGDAPTSYVILSKLAPWKDGAAAGGIPLPGATGLLRRVVNAIATSPLCLPAR